MSLTDAKPGLCVRPNISLTSNFLAVDAEDAVLAIKHAGEDVWCFVVFGDDRIAAGPGGELVILVQVEERV